MTVSPAVRFSRASMLVISSMILIMYGMIFAL